MDDESYKTLQAYLSKEGTFENDGERRECARAMVTAAMALLEDDFASGELVKFHREAVELAKVYREDDDGVAVLVSKLASLSLSVLFFARFRQDASEAAEDITTPRSVGEN